MRRLPVEVHYVQVALDHAELLAHRFRFSDTVGGDRQTLKGAAKCGAADRRPLPLMSAYSADRFEAEPCEHEQCFGPDLARPPAEWRTLVATAPAPAKAKPRRRLQAVPS